MARFVYKICPRQAWDEAVAAGRYQGSPDDRRDGFIHLSTAEQLAGTLARHFAGQDGLVLVTLDAAAVAGTLRFEASSGGNLYPHVYGDLPVAAARAVTALQLGPDGRHVLPDLREDCAC